jgi:hypothetical protein
MGASTLKYTAPGKDFWKNETMPIIYDEGDTFFVVEDGETVAF